MTTIGIILVEMEFSSYSWLEQLANAINGEMTRRTPPNEYQQLFGIISTQYEIGDEETKKAIDVAFVENLFWKVGKIDAKPYWDLLPSNLKDLYIGFHGQPPL